MANYIDDIFIFIGCVLILIGAYQINPLITLFVGGFMFLAAGVMIGAGNRKEK